MALVAHLSVWCYAAYGAAGWSVDVVGQLSAAAPHISSSIAAADGVRCGCIISFKSLARYHHMSFLLLHGGRSGGSVTVHP